MKISDVIYTNRIRLGLSQNELAKRAQISGAYIDALECGMRSNLTIKMILRLSAALGIPPYLFLGDAGTRSEEISLAEAIQVIIDHNAQISAMHALTESLAATIAQYKIREGRRELGEIR